MIVWVMSAFVSWQGALFVQNCLEKKEFFEHALIFNESKVKVRTID